VGGHYVFVVGACEASCLDPIGGDKCRCLIHMYTCVALKHSGFLKSVHIPARMCVCVCVYMCMHTQTGEKTDHVCMCKDRQGNR